MAIKKSDLYSSSWATCDELRGAYKLQELKTNIIECEVKAHMKKTGICMEVSSSSLYFIIIID